MRIVPVDSKLHDSPIFVPSRGVLLLRITLATVRLVALYLFYDCDGRGLYHSEILHRHYIFQDMRVIARSIVPITLMRASLLYISVAFFCPSEDSSE